MKKSLLALVTGTAIASGGYFIAQQGANNNNFAHLDNVPDDTLFLWSQLNSFPYLQYLDVLPDTLKNVDDINNFVAAMQGQEVDSNTQFLLNILDKYANSLKSSKQFTSTWGVNSDFQALAYSVGLLPVLRAELGDPQVFKNTVINAAKEANIQYEDTNIEGIPVTKFLIEQEGNKIFDLLVAIDGKWVTVTFDTPINDQNDLKIALGITAPTTPLSSTDKVQRYIQDHQLDGHALAYLDTRLLADMLTAKDPQSKSTQMLDKILALTDSENALDSVRNPNCQQDFSDIANKWPAVITGTQAYEFSNNYGDITVSSVIASTDTKVLNALKNIRGFLPQHTQSDSDAMLALGIGFNASQLSPSVNTIWAAFASAQFNCEPLAQLQAQSKDANPAPLAMATSMLGTLKGVSLTVFDANIADLVRVDNTDLSSVDMLLTVSADDMLALFNMAKSFAPDLAGLTLPADGSAIEVNQYLPPDYQSTAPLYLALKGQHLTLYIGKTAQQTADALSTQTVTANGMVNFAVNTDKIMPMLLQAAELSGEPITDDMAELLRESGKVHFSLDTTDKGIVADITIKVESQ
ncbi:hypothetical protein [Pseudoalteromonas obscura]|uniref:DUF3352 domain-containing protein n=1 Tax=Pseudoalteromonas obscura TaxID=3048491 RepID=A0ABT7EM81_9GAMM|nr:hypothetical protein [Pseudoalteromonas sp. P94(2023)]MDK2596167.1 hypothetical protein [Pseudoalteromonas sp. P94(2023)]